MYKFFGLPPRPAQQIGLRTVALWVMTERYNLEYHIANCCDEEERAILTESFKRMNDWVARSGIIHLLTPTELRLYQKPFGSWSEEDLSEVACWYDAFEVMLWAIGKIDFVPVSDAPGSEEDFEELWYEMLDPAQFSANLSLRLVNVLNREYAHAACLSIHGVVEVRYLSSAIGFDDYIRQVGIITEEYREMRLAGSQFRCGENLLEQPFAGCDLDEVALLTESALVRFYALGWVLNQTAYWDLNGAFSEDSLSSCPPLSMN